MRKTLDKIIEHLRFGTVHEHNTIANILEQVGDSDGFLMVYCAREKSGLEMLLKPPTGQGCKSKVPESVAAALKATLDTENGLSGYGDVQDWLQERGVELTYGGTHYYVHYVLGAGLKVPRPRSIAQEPARMEV